MYYSKNAVKRIQELVKQKGISVHRFEMECGLSNATVQGWIKYNNVPSAESLRKVADYFGVTVDYLLGVRQEADFDTEAVVWFDELGVVRAGYGGSVNEIPTGKKICIPTSMLKGHEKSEYFTLRVSGNSMYPRLLEGDTILCLRCDSVDNGDFAVVLYDGDEATVKKVVYTQGEDWLELVPCNPEYPAKRIQGNALSSVRILGKVVKLIRDMA